MLKRYGLLLALSLFALASTGLAVGDGITKRVRFTKGRTSVTPSNSVVRGDVDTYILGAKTGQKNDGPHHLG